MPNTGDATLRLAFDLEAERQYESAWEIASGLLAKARHVSDVAVLCGRIAVDLKCEAEAIEIIDRLLSAIPERPPAERSSLHYAAAGLLDHLGRYDEAFEHASKANRLRGGIYSPELAERLVASFIEYFSPSAQRRIARASNHSDVPVFIVGMPRSGTTLIEQILASHPLVHAAGELDWIVRLWSSAVSRFSTPSAPLSWCLEVMSPSDLDDLAAQYLTPLRELNPAAARITNKMPTNFMHLGLISILFPRARIIYCRRNPLDTCLSCFMTDLASGNNHALDLSTAGHFYRQSGADHGPLEIRARCADSGSRVRKGGRRSRRTNPAYSRVPRYSLGRPLPEVS